MFKPVNKKINSSASPDVVIHNIGMHIGKRQGIFSGGERTLFSGDVNPAEGRFIIRSQNQSFNRNSIFVRAEGQVEGNGNGKGSIVNLSLQLSRVGIFFLIGMMLLLLVSAVAFVLNGPFVGAEDGSLLPMVIGGASLYVLFIGFILRMAIRREFHILESFVRNQSGAGLAA